MKHIRLGFKFLSFRLIIIITLLSSILLAQENEDILEDDIILPKETPAQKILEELKSNPLDLNAVKYDELIKIPYLTSVLANRIIKARQNKNHFHSISELLEIPGIDDELLEKISYLLFIKPPIKNKTSGLFRLQVKLDTISDIAKTENYEVTNRINIISSSNKTKLRAIILTNKDAKEKNLFDFSSISVSVANNDRKLVLGNYLLNFGSQLLFAGPYSYINSAKNFSQDILKSMNEFSGLYNTKPLFGIGFSQVISKLYLNFYLSSTYLDAEIKSGVVKKVYYYTKYTDSLSQARRNRLQENLIGTRFTYSPNQSALIGTTAYHNIYDKPFSPIDSTNSFYGRSINLLGVDIKSHLGNYFLVSELGYSINHGFGFSNQIIGDWQGLKVNLNIYAQQKNFFSPHSKWRELTNRKDKITGSFNIFYNLSGFKMYFLASTKQDFTTDSLPARIQYRLERRQGPLHLGLTLKGSYKEGLLTTYSTRLDLRYSLNKYFQINCRLVESTLLGSRDPIREDRYLKNSSASRVGSSRRRVDSTGGLLYWGVKFVKHDLTLESRIYYFNITSSSCKIYCYEPSNGSYGFNNKGIRIFTSFKAETSNYLKIQYHLGYTKTDKKNLDTALQFLFNL